MAAEPEAWLKGFMADVRGGSEHLRLFAHVIETGWGASVYNMKLHAWIMRDQGARDAETAKRLAEGIAGGYVQGNCSFDWYPIGGPG
jgi:hypothetical protein